SNLFASAIRKVQLGKINGFVKEYSCSSPKEERYFLCRITGLQGEEKQVIITHENITNIKLAQKQLIISEEKYRSTFMNSPLGIVIAEEDGNIIEINKKVTQILGYSKKELLNKNIYEFTHKNDQLESKSNYTKTVLGKAKHFSMQKRYVKKNGTIIWAKINVSAIYDSNKKFLFNVGMLNNITEEKKYLELLEQNEQKYKSLYLLLNTMADNLPDMMWAKDLNKQFLFTNKALRKGLLNAKSDSEPIGKNILYFAKREKESHPEIDNYYTFGEECQDTDEIIIKNSKAMRFNIYGNVKNEYLYLEAYKAPLYNTQGKLIGTVGSARDLTKEKGIEEKLISSEKKFSKAFHNAPIIAGFTELSSGRYVEVNKTFYRILKYKKSEVIGKNASSLIKMDPTFKERVLPKLKKNGRLANEETIIYNKYGDPVNVLMFAEVIKIDGVDYNFTTAIDITKRKTYEEDLKLFSEAVNQSQVSVIITNTSGQIEFVNPKFSETTGYTLGEVSGKNPNLLKSGEMDEAFYEEMWNKISTGQQWKGIFHNKKKNGELFWESAVISPIKNESGVVTHFIALKEDITEIVKKDKKLKEYQSHLEDLVKERTEQLEKEIELRKKDQNTVKEALIKEKKLNKLKSDFVSMVSHEFRTPLTSIRSSLELIERFGINWEKEKIEYHYTKIKNSIDNLTSMLEEMLDLSHSNSDKINFQPRNSNVENLIKNILVELEPLISSDHRIDYFSSLTNNFCYIDPKLIKVILTNLLSNAIKYSPQGGVIRIEVSENINHLVFKVSDQGIGINPEDIKEIFNPFFRAKAVTTIKGSGLGLSIVKNYVDLHSGNLEVESNPGEGSNFIITIPINNCRMHN
ncbi:PAS domain S-box protein, partial [Candidatus Woesearchaeota archaeon]|nr:PAS domain S-box protein [Candidatus Woesearchaeota archaeon]